MTITANFLLLILSSNMRSRWRTWNLPKLCKLPLLKGLLCLRKMKLLQKWNSSSWFVVFFNRWFSINSIDMIAQTSALNQSFSTSKVPLLSMFFWSSYLGVKWTKVFCLFISATKMLIIVDAFDVSACF